MEADERPIFSFQVFVLNLLIWAGTSALADDISAYGLTGNAIPFSKLSSKVSGQYQGDGLSVLPAPEGAHLRCVFQKLEGEATCEGLWLTSTVTNSVNDRFRIVAAAVGREGADPERAATAYLYTSAALLVGAGLRLIALGQLDGQRVLASMRGRIARLAAAAATARADELWSFTPALEIAGIRHAALDLRLFRS